MNVSKKKKREKEAQQERIKPVTCTEMTKGTSPTNVTLASWDNQLEIDDTSRDQHTKAAADHKKALASFEAEKLHWNTKWTRRRRELVRQMRDWHSR